MRPVEAVLFAAGLLVLSASLNHARAAEAPIEPTEPAEPEKLVPRVQEFRPPVKIVGPAHANPFNKPCLKFEVVSRPHLFNQALFDYVVGIENICPQMIKIRICQKDSSGCTSATVRAYHSSEVVMGFGPKTDYFEYTAKEEP